MICRYLSRAFFIMPIAALTYFLFGGCSKQSDNQTSRGGGKAAVPVEALVIKPQLLRNTIFATGTLLANEEVELRPEISGRVTGVFFEEGKRVKKGELLLKINDRELEAELKSKEVEEKQAADEESRKRKLYDIKVISQQEYDNVLNSLKIVQAEKEAIEAQLAETEITAPFDGFIGLRYVSEGGYISPDVLLATMQEIDPMKVEFSIPEKYAGQIKNGTGILVRVGDSPERHKGVIYAIESKIDLDTRTIKSRARIPNPEEKLIPGSFAGIEITLEELPDAVVIPSEAVVPEISGEKVYICKNGKAKYVSVKTGIRTEREVEITQGLTAGDTLIVTGLLQLADDKDIEIKALRSN
jgi:membrane fusion protein (multidrug efflux system)